MWKGHLPGYVGVTQLYLALRRRPHDLAVLRHQGAPHRLVLVVHVEAALLLRGEGSHRQQELGDVVGQPALSSARL